MSDDIKPLQTETDFPETDFPKSQQEQDREQETLKLKKAPLREGPKYTNPARGILDFCWSKSWGGSSLCVKWGNCGLTFPGLTFVADFSWTDFFRLKEHWKNIEPVQTVKSLPSEGPKYTNSARGILDLQAKVVAPPMPSMNQLTYTIKRTANILQPTTGLCTRLLGLHTTAGLCTQLLDFRKTTGRSLD